MTKRTRTIRVLATMAAATLALTACGGADDDESTAEPAADEAPAADEPSSDTTVDEPASGEPADDPDEEPADDADTAADDGSTGDSADDGATDDADDDVNSDDGDTIVVRSVDDIPERCRDIMADYFRAVEPAVADIDWAEAGIGVLDQLGDDLEEASAAFEDDVTAEGCDELEFADDNDFQLLIEFARDVAPGVVGYLEFLDGFGTGSSSDDDPDAADDAFPTPGDFADCGEAVDYVRGLLDEYGTFADVPPTEIMQLAGLSTVLDTCTPDQLEFFDSPDWKNRVMKLDNCTEIQEKLDLMQKRLAEMEKKLQSLK